MNAKKLLALVLALALCVGCFAGCGTTDAEETNAPTNASVQTPANNDDG